METTAQKILAAQWAAVERFNTVFRACSTLDEVVSARPELLQLLNEVEEYTEFITPDCDKAKLYVASTVRFVEASRKMLCDD